MIRQTRIYLAGAVSGTALVVAAVVVFMVLVSLQVLRDWPLSGLSGAGGEPPASRSAAPEQPSPAGGDALEAGAAAGTGGGVVSSGGQGGGDGAGSPGANGPVAGAPDQGRPGTDDSLTPAAGSAPAGGGADTGGGTDRGSGESGSNGDDNPASLTETATGAVNETVAGVDDAPGGALGDPGVTDTVEDVVKGAAGPDSKAGDAVDRTAEPVDGLLGEDR